MNSEAPIKNLIDQLKHHFQAEMVVHQFSIAISLDKLRRELTLSTTVYQGQNYIPLSVRHAVSGHGLGPASAMKGVLSIDEENFAVRLTYCGVASDLSEGMLAYMLEEFSWLAEQWRWILDEQDRRDLVHVPTK
jgi:hypothetical protein